MTQIALRAATLIASLSVFLNSTFLFAAVPLDTQQAITKIAFGSCLKERRAFPAWQAIASQQPDVLMMIGDNQYADQQWRGGEWKSESADNIEQIEQAYARLGNNKGYAKLQSTFPIMAVWDDHDYGSNDSGKEYGLKAESQQAFLDFYGFAKDDPLRQQQGIYHSKIVGPEGKRVQFIMLDTRYHRDPLLKKPEGKGFPGRFVPHTDSTQTILGETQWQWLEAELRKPAEIRFIASSIQVVAYQHGWESWGNFPAERQRLYDVISKTEAEGVIVVSGDRHLMELSKETGQAGNKVPYPIWDFTASGLNEDFDEVNEPNLFRVGPVHRQTNFGFIRIKWPENGEAGSIQLTGYDGDKQVLINQRIGMDELSVGSE